MSDMLTRIFNDEFDNFGRKKKKTFAEKNEGQMSPLKISIQ